MSISRYQITFDSIKIFENEEKTRTFIALGVNQEDYLFLNRIVEKLDFSLEEFNLPPFYEVGFIYLFTVIFLIISSLLFKPPDYHASFLWCLGSHGAAFRELVGNLNEILDDLICAQATDDLQIQCDNIECKIGNKLYKFPIIN